MSCIYNNENDTERYNSRSKKRQRGSSGQEHQAKRKKMETSTPTTIRDYRDVKLIPDEDSPIKSVGNETPNDLTGGTEHKSPTDLIEHKSPTQISNNMDNTKLSPDKVLSESEIERKLVGGAGDLSGALRKSKSLPNLSWETVENSFFIHYPTRNKHHIVRRHSTMDEVDITS